MKFALNSDDENYASVWHYARILRDMDMRDDSSEVVLNICSINHKKLKQGNKCTIYIEGDEFTIKGSNKNFYEGSNLVYICNKGYLSYYPLKTKVIQSGVDPEWHYPRDVKKECEYISIMNMKSDSVYDNRHEKLEELKKKDPTILIAQCPPDEYPTFLSKGRIILNILPRRGEDVSGNYRLLEGCACGVLMTDSASCVDDLGLIPNVHYLPLNRFGEKFSDEELNRIHKTGRKYVCENFSYKNAIKTIIKDMEAL